MRATLRAVDAQLGKTPGPWFLGGDAPSLVFPQYVTHVERMEASLLYWRVCGCARVRRLLLLVVEEEVVEGEVEVEVEEEVVPLLLLLRVRWKHRRAEREREDCAISTHGSRPLSLESRSLQVGATFTRRPTHSPRRMGPGTRRTARR